MVHFRFTAAAVMPALAFLSACSSPGSSAAPQVVRMASSATIRHALPLGNLIFPVANNGGNDVTFYARRGTGDIAPVASIGGDKTGLTGPAFLARDPGGRLFVTDPSNNSVRVFAAEANGNVAPIQVIDGPHTGLAEPNGIAFRRNLIFVASHRGELSRINVYGAGSDGDVAPIRTIKGSLTGLNAPRGVALDASGYIYVSNIGANTITVYAPDAEGNVAPIRTISGSNTQLEGGNGVALDSADRIYTVAAGSTRGKVLVFNAGANGNVAPAQVITGAKTQLASPAGIAVKAGEIYVSNYSSAPSSISVYPTGGMET